MLGFADIVHDVTTINDLIAPDLLHDALDQGLVATRDSRDGFTILNYTERAVYTPGAWSNPATRICRGLIADTTTGVVIARPWEKFFNHNQAEAGGFDLDAPVEVTDKMDGSLGIIHHDRAGRPRVATRGSFESEQAIHATTVLHDRYNHIAWPPDLTVLVEIVYPQNRIVVSYGDLDDLILLGAVRTSTGSYIGPVEAQQLTGWDGPVTTVFTYPTMRDALAAVPRPGAEGLCVRFLNQDRIVKIKQDDYIRLHRIVSGLSERTVWEHALTGQPVESLLDGLPDELHQWVRDVRGRLDSEVARVVAAAAVVFDAICSAPSRKDFAVAAAQHPEFRAMLFVMLDGGDPAGVVLKGLKPQAGVRAVPAAEVD